MNSFGWFRSSLNFERGSLKSVRIDPRELLLQHFSMGALQAGRYNFIIHDCTSNSEAQSSAKIAYKAATNLRQQRLGALIGASHFRVPVTIAMSSRLTPACIAIKELWRED